jgi:endonuclease/exonuclease/phosphatase family metal-dependent hydrolase
MMIKFCKAMNMWIVSILLLGPSLLVLGKDNPSGERNSLKILSYNIKHGRGMDGRVDLKRTAEVIRSFSPDLVTLQEVDKNCTRSGSIDLTQELAGILKMEGRFGKFMDFQGGEYGMAALSKFPITSHQVHVLPRGAEPRCALEVRVNPGKDWGEIRLFGIHHDWTRETLRTNQCRGLLQAVGEKSKPVVLAGDFNAGRSSGSVGLLLDAGFHILANSKTNTFPSKNPNVEIDFIMSRNLSFSRFKHQVIEEKLASDHRPVLVELFK